MPEGYEVQVVKCGEKKESVKTYQDLIDNNIEIKGYYISPGNRIVPYKGWACERKEDFDSMIPFDNRTIENNCTSEKQIEKLLAINKLMNVAKYLNCNWKPDWDNMEEDKFYIRYNQASHTLQVGAASILYSNIVYFKSEKLVQQAIEILGEETIKLALSTDW